MRHYIDSIEALKSTEQVRRFTKSYIPIYTTEVIKQYTKLNTKFKYAIINSTKTQSVCQAVLENNIVLQNSYDGTQSFRIKYNFGTFVFGNFRLIHRGANATDFNENNQFFIESLEKYNKFYSLLQTETFSDDVINKILKEVNKVKNNTITINYTNKNAIHVLNHTINCLMEGDYTYTNSKGIVKQGRKTRSMYVLFWLQNNISKMLIDLYPESFL